MEDQEKTPIEEQYNNGGINEEVASGSEEEKVEIPEIPQENKTVNSDNKKKTSIIPVIGYGILAVAVIILFILHFCQPKSVKTIPVRTGDAPQALIITVNTDSVMEHFELVKLLKNDLEQETEKYQKELQTKSAAFESKYQNYIINVQNNVLTQTQMQNAERQLMQEKESLEALSSRYTKILVDKEMSVQNELMDSLKNVSKRINEASYNADYIFAINAGSAVLHSNETYDITDEVIKELNESYKKATK